MAPISRLTARECEGVADLRSAINVAVGHEAVLLLEPSSALSGASVAADRAATAILGSYHPVDDMAAALIAPETGAVIQGRSAIAADGNGVLVSAPGVTAELAALVERGYFGPGCAASGCRPWCCTARTIPGSAPGPRSGARLITYPGTGHEFPQRLWPVIARDVREAARQADAAGHHGNQPTTSVTRPAAQSRKDQGMRSRKYRLMTTLERGSNRLNRLALRAGIAPRVRPAGNDRPPHRQGPAHPGRQRPGRRHLLALRRPRYPGRLRPQPPGQPPGQDQSRRHLAHRDSRHPPRRRRARSRTLPCQWDAAIGRIMASAPLTIRINLDPAPGPH
jgi:hypothetical protein